MGSLKEWITEYLGWKLDIVRRPTKEEHREAVRGIVKERLKEGIPPVECWRGLSYTRTISPQPTRWVIERTFTWLVKSRRLSKDYEFLPETSEIMVSLVMLRLMLKRLSKTETENAPKRV